MIPKDRRSHVRGDISFRVKFTVLTPEQYENIEKSNWEIFSLNEKQHRLNIADVNNRVDGEVDATLINFLIHIDEKLDHVLSLLSQDKRDKVIPKEGIGVNISGSGMSIMVEEPVEYGQVIHTKLFRSQFSLVFLDIFGEVVRVTPENKGIYNLGVKFLNLNEKDRDRIISAVFQRQREIIRKRKNEGLI